MVETEFASRLYSQNADKAAASYTKFKVEIYYSYFPKVLLLYLFSIFINVGLLLQALEAIDVANSVIYVLSAPPHVQVQYASIMSLMLSLMFLPLLFVMFCYFTHNGTTFMSFLSDWRHSDATCGAGVVVL